MTGKARLSVVCPAYEEEESLPHFHRELGAVLDTLANRYDVEVIYVDDGSADGTLGLLRRLAASDPRVRYLSFSRNFGHQAAIMAGMESATGDVVVTLDSDLQHPPALIPTLLEKWREGNDVVLTVRQEDPELGWFKRLSSRWFYRLINRVSDTPIPFAAADFRLLSRRALDGLLRLREARPFLRGLVQWLGFPQAEVPFVPARRTAGTSKYNLWRMVGLSLDALFSFSKVPLRVATVLGLLATSVGLILAGVGLVRAAFGLPGADAGHTFLLVTVYLLGGGILFALGALGEYVGRVHDQVRARPLFLVKEQSSTPGEAPVGARRVA